MNIAVVTLFPEMFDALTQFGISGRAASSDAVNIECFNPRDYTEDRHRTVDDRPYGGGPGMVMMVEPLKRAVVAAKEWLQQFQPEAELLAKVVYLSPQGQVFNQVAAKTFAQEQNLVLVAGRYEGVDERFIQRFVDEEWSIGDYVLSGGELPAMVMLDAIIRLLPNSLGHAQSAEQDSFSQGLLDYPHYTRPEVYEEQAVPEVLLCGDHKKIEHWRQQQALLRTATRRPELLAELTLTEEQRQLLKTLDQG